MDSTGKIYNSLARSIKIRQLFNLVSDFQLVKEK